MKRKWRKGEASIAETLEVWANIEADPQMLEVMHWR